MLLEPLRAAIGRLREQTNLLACSRSCRLMKENALTAYVPTIWTRCNGVFIWLLVLILAQFSPTLLNPPDLDNWKMGLLDTNLSAFAGTTPFAWFLMASALVNAHHPALQALIIDEIDTA